MCIFAISKSGTKLDDDTVIKIGISTFQDDIELSKEQSTVSESIISSSIVIEIPTASTETQVSTDAPIAEELPVIDSTETKDYIVIRGIEHSIYDEELFLESGTTANDIVDLDKMTCLKKLFIRPYDGGCVVVVEYDGEIISNLSTIRNLTSLEHLRVIWTNITNVEDLANLKNLNHLELNHSKIVSIGTLENLTNLEYLDICDNQISDIACLKSLSKLKYLDLSNNPIKNIDALSNLVSLKTLHIGNYESDLGAYLITDEVECFSDVSALKNLNNLNRFSIYNTQTYDISPLSNLSSLEYLYLNGNKIQNIKPLFKLTQLKDLNLSDNNVSDIEGIEQLTGLEKLWLTGNDIIDYSPLSSMTSLKELEIGISGAEDMEQVLKLTCLENLENLYIEVPYATKLTEEEEQILKDSFDCSVSFWWRS